MERAPESIAIITGASAFIATLQAFIIVGWNYVASLLTAGSTGLVGALLMYFVTSRLDDARQRLRNRGDIGVNAGVRPFIDQLRRAPTLGKVTSVLQKDSWLGGGHITTHRAFPDPPDDAAWQLALRYDDGVRKAWRRYIDERRQLIGAYSGANSRVAKALREKVEAVVGVGVKIEDLTERGGEIDFAECAHFLLEERALVHEGLRAGFEGPRARPTDSTRQTQDITWKSTRLVTTTNQFAKAIMNAIQELSDSTELRGNLSKVDEAYLRADQARADLLREMEAVRADGRPRQLRLWRREMSDVPR